MNIEVSPVETPSGVPRWVSAAGLLIALMVAGMPATSAILELVHKDSPGLTAAAIYLPALLGILVLVRHAPPFGPRQKTALLFLALLALSWIFNCVRERLFTDVHLDEYDLKRVWFFIPQFALAGLAGILAGRIGSKMVLPILKSLIFCAGGVSILYLLNFDPVTVLGRLLENKSLAFAVLGSYGATSGILVLLGAKRRTLGWRRKGLIWALIFACLVAIVLSGTRGALLAFAMTLVLAPLSLRRYKQAVWMLILLLFIGSVVFIFFNDMVPVATFERLGELKKNGYDIRQDLVNRVLQVIIANPFGKIYGYDQSILAFDYCHNTLLQTVSEFGLVQALPILLIMFAAIIHRAVKNYDNLLYCSFLVLFFNIFFQSSSSGQAYNTAFWFGIFFLLAFDSGDVPLSVEGLNA